MDNLSERCASFWVADMDFPAPRPILDELHKAVDQGVLGYELVSNTLLETVAARMDHLYGWKVKPDSIVPVTGIVSGFNVAARAFGSPKKGYLVQPPVYNEFHDVKNNVGIPQIDVPFVKHVQGNILHYEIDWELFKKQVKKVSMFLLCSPHNPLGIVFSRRDLLRMAEICIENNVLIISDEIHSELLLDDKKFTPMAKLSSEIAKNTITLVAPSKTWLSRFGRDGTVKNSFVAANRFARTAAALRGVANWLKNSSALRSARVLRWCEFAKPVLTVALLDRAWRHVSKDSWLRF